MEKAIELDMTFLIAYRHIFQSLPDRLGRERAIELAERLIKLRPENPMGHRFLAQTYVATGDSTEIELAINQALKYHQTDDELRDLYYDLAYVVPTDDSSGLSQQEAYLREALELDPDSIDFRVITKLGSVLTQQERYEEASRCYRRGMYLNSGSGWCLKGLAAIARAQEKYDTAVHYSRRAIAVESQDPAYHAALFEGCFQAERFQEADSAITAGLSVLPRLPGRVELLLRAAGFYDDNNNKNKAELLYRQAAEIDTAGITTGTLNELVKILIARRKWDEAERFARRSLEFMPDSWSSVRRLIQVLVGLEQYAEAIDLGRELVEKWPKSNRLNYRYIGTIIAAGRFAEADSLLEEALNGDLKPTVKANYLWELGYAYWKVDSLDKCERFAERGLELAPKHKGLHRDLGHWYTVRGKYDTAKILFDKLLDIDSAYVWIYRRLAIHYLLQDKYAEAEESFSKGLGLNSRWAALMRGYGYLYCVQGKYDEALPWAQKALAADSGFLNQNILARVLVAGEIDVPRGIEMISTAMTEWGRPARQDLWIRHQPQVPLPHYTLGLGYLKTGQYDLALESLEQAATQRPNVEAIKRDLGEVRNRLGNRSDTVH